MPEYFRPLQLPQGMAEQLAAMRMQKGQNMANMIQSLGQSFGGAISEYAQRKNNSLTPEQIQYLNNMVNPQKPVGPGLMGSANPLSIGQQAPPPNPFQGGRINPAGQRYLESQQSLAERMAASKEATSRTLGAAELRGESGHMQLTQEMIDANPNLKKQNLHPGYYPTSFVNSLVANKGQTASLSLQEHQQQFDDKRYTQLGDALDPSKQRQGAFGVSKQVFDRAERLETLGKSYKDGNLDQRQIEELAIGLNSMLSGANVGSTEQVKSLVPKSAVGNFQKFKEWFVNDPQGTNQQEFVKRMMGSIEREKSTAAAQLKRTQFQRVSRYSDLEKKDQDRFNQVLESNGVDPQEYQKWKKGGFKAISAVQSPESTGKSTQLEPQTIGRFQVQVQ